LAEPPFPWLYAYQEDGPRLDGVTLRPIVPMALVGAEVSSTVYALVDSGCSHVLAAPWLAHSAGVDPKASGRTLRLGLGGSVEDVQFADVRLRLMAPANDDNVFVEWEAEVGFIKQWKPTWPMLVGQVGFMDQFTVTPSLYAKQVAVEHHSEFDRRFGVPLALTQPDDNRLGRHRRF
jgi:hypothetical protein